MAYCAASPLFLTAECAESAEIFLCFFSARFAFSAVIPSARPFSHSSEHTGIIFSFSVVMGLE